MNFYGNRLFQFTIIGMVLLLLAYPVMGQGQSAYLEYYGKSLEMNNIGMGILGGWALANISIGAYGWSQQTGQSSYFHQMNLFWNTVNLSIAGFALYNNLTSDYALLPGEELLEMQEKTQRLFLINTGLDVAYVATGFFLKYLAPKYPKTKRDSGDMEILLFSRALSSLSLTWSCMGCTAATGLIF